jgi:hypothetical protein
MPCTSALHALALAIFVWLIRHQPAVFFSQNKSAISNQPAVLFSQNKSASAISHQPNEQAVCCQSRINFVSWGGQSGRSTILPAGLPRASARGFAMRPPRRCSEGGLVPRFYAGRWGGCLGVHAQALHVVEVIPGSVLWPSAATTGAVARTWHGSS